jgi:hypothetical protein
MDKLSYLLKKAFKYYDEKKNYYEDFINDNNIIMNKEESTITFKNNNKKFKYQLLGLFHNQTNVWIWSWMIPTIDIQNSLISRKLLEYGLKINVFGDDNDELYLRTQFVNSRFLLNNDIQLDIHLSLSSYIAKDNFLFIYPYKVYLNENKTEYYTLYLCLLDNNKNYLFYKNKINLKNRINEIMLNSFKIYDKKNNEYKKLINDHDIYLDKEEGLIIFNKINMKFKYELLGIFDNTNLIWIWSWMIPSISFNKMLLSKKVLDYGLNLETKNNDDTIYLKTQFLNSRFKIDNNLQLEINLILSTYIIREDFLFLYPLEYKFNNNKNKITRYLLITKKK